MKNYSTAPEGLALDDLRLLHHFTTKTYATLDCVVSQQLIWRDYIVQVGFQHSFLLRGVLAISALHLATLDLKSSAPFVLQASNQYNCALLDFRNVLRSVGEENCVAVFSFSCLTVVYAFAVAQVHELQDPIADFLNCMHLVQGVATVLGPHYPVLMMSDVRPILENSVKGVDSGEIPEILRLKILVHSLPDDDHGETSSAYIHAIDLLHTVFLETKLSVSTQSFLGLIFSWPALLSPIFFSSLSIQEPVAIIIVAHFAAILGSKRDIWWIANWNEYIINSVEARLSNDLLEWLIWPRQICNKIE